MKRQVLKNNPSIALAAGALNLLVAGVIYAWSILKMPLEAAFGWTGSPLALNFTITFCFFCIGGLVAGLLRKKHSAQRIMTLSALLVSVGFYLVSRLDGAHIWQLYVFYGIFCGFGIGMVYNTVVSTVSLWFLDRTGLCSGILMLCFGMSSLVFGTAANAINHHSADGWRITFRLLAIVSGIVFLGTSRMIRVPASREAVRTPAAASGDSQERKTEYSTWEMLRRPSFFLFFIYSTLCSMVGNCVFSFAGDFTVSLGSSLGLAAALTGVFSISNGLGRILCGALYDAIGRRSTMICANIVTIFAPILAALSVQLHSLALGIGSLVLLGISYGSCPTITAAFTGEFYGRKHYSQNFSVMNSVLIPASFAAPAVSRIAGSTGSYTLVFLILALCAVAAFALNIKLKNP